MNGLANNNDDNVECPLCMEPFEVDDLTFYPCTCGYQICRFCWHRIRTDENKLCPACRKEYPENPADFKPLTQEEMIAFKSQKRQRDQQRKQKITENRKHLANVRVVQKNLVFVVGLPPRLADADILKKHEYFGKYGKIHKVVINPSTTYAGVQGPSASAYVTYVHNADALRAIQSVNNIMIDGRLIKTSLGTTKYCSHFMKNQQCPKGDCMYLHDLGDSEASFTKEEMHQGKHQEYEKRLHDALIAASGANNIAGIVGSANSSIVSGNGTSKTNASVTMSSSSSTSSVSTANTSSSVNAQKEAWPSLSISPINTKDVLGNVTTVSGKSKKDKSRNEKGRHEKSKAKSKNNVCLTSNTSNKENYTPEKIPVSIDTTGTTTSSTDLNAASSQHKTERNKDKGTSRTAISKDQNKTKDNVESSENNKQLQLADDDLNPNNIKSSEKMFSLSKRSANNTHRSPSSSSENSDDHVSESSVSENSTPDSFSNARSSVSHTESKKETSLKSDADKTSKNMKRDRKTTELDSTKLEDSINISQEEIEKFDHSKNDCTNEMSDALSKLNVFDDSNSFFSSSNAFQQPSILRNKVDGDIRQSQMSPVPTSHLPDLLNGIDSYQKTSNTNEWEEAFKNVMLRNNRQVEEQVLHQQQLQLQQQHHHQQVLQQQEEFLRMHEIQKRSGLVNNSGISQSNSTQSDFPSHFHGNAPNISRTQSHTPVHPQHMMQPSEDNPINTNNIFGGNMSKFFDFHKSQQQLHHQYINGHSLLNNNDSHRLAIYLESSRNNPAHYESGIQQLQKPKPIGSYDKVSQSQQQSQQNRFSLNSLVDDDLGFDPFVETQKGLAELMENEMVQQQNVNIGNVGSKMQQQSQAGHHQLLDNMQRARMPPPGFNHMNALSFDSTSRSNSSKMLPLIMSSRAVGNTSSQIEQQQMQLQTNWNPHLATIHQGQPISDSHLQHQVGQATVCHNKGYSNSDWTAMDPAILSFRQFSSFPHQGPMPLHQQDFFLQQLAQQPPQQQQNGTGFNNQTQQMLGMNLTNNLISGQSPSMTQVNANVQGMLEFLKTRQFV